MDHEAYEATRRRAENVDLNGDPRWREERQRQLDELGWMSGQRYTLPPNGSIRVEKVDDEKSDKITLWIPKPKNFR